MTRSRKDWRNYEHFRCRACGRTWEEYSPHSYDGGDSSPFWQPELCAECWEEQHAADMAEQAAEDEMEAAARRVVEPSAEQRREL